MPITNAQAVQFSNAQLRVLADALVSAYWTAKVVVANYYASPELGTAYTEGIAEPIADGPNGVPGGDGRQIVTGNDALGLITQASAWVSTCEANGGAVLNVLLGYAVNGQSKV